MRQQILGVGVLTIALTGCSLIVGNKLDEKGGDARPASGEARTDGGGGVTIRTERGKRYAVVGEVLELTAKHPDWPRARIISLSPKAHPDQKSACVYLGFDQEKLRCVIPSKGSDGLHRVGVYTDDEKLLGEAELELRRLVMVSGPEQQRIYLYTSDPFEPDGTIELMPKKILASHPAPLLSPSGRYLLASLDDGLNLIDLVSSGAKPLKIASLQSPPVAGTIPHAFEPRFGAVDASPLPYAPHYPEERVWVVDDKKKLKVFEVAKILEGTPSFVDKQEPVQQVLWGVSPKMLANTAEQARALVLSTKQPAALTQTHYTINSKGQLKPVTINTKAMPQMAVHALPAHPPDTLVRELVFVIMLRIDPIGGTELHAVRENDTVAPLGSLSYDTLNPKPLDPNALVTIPWTSLVGFNFDVYPQASGTVLHGLLLDNGGALSLEIGQGSKVAFGLGGVGRRHEVQPTSFGAWRMLVHDGDAVATFERGQKDPAWQLLVSGFENVAHHPRESFVYATKANVVLRYRYTDKEPIQHQLPQVVQESGVYVQP